MFSKFPPKEGENGDAFQKQITDFSKRPEAIVMRDLNSHVICWETNSARHDLSRKFLTSLADNFVLQKVKESTRDSVALHLMLTNKEDLIEKIKLTNNLGEGNYVILEFLILRESKLSRIKCIY